MANCSSELPIIYCSQLGGIWSVNVDFCKKFLSSRYVELSSKTMEGHAVSWANPKYENHTFDDLNFLFRSAYETKYLKC